MVLLLDQVSKTWALHALDDGNIIELVGSLQLQLAFNTGAAFSSGTGFGPVIGVIAIAVVLVLIWTSRSVGSRLGTVAVGLVLGGALGNIADRAFRSGDGGFLGGAVVDWIDPQFWPIFNLADACVVVGGILLVFTVGLAPDKEEADPVSEPSSS
jgi:signal peptidase II